MWTVVVLAMAGTDSVKLKSMTVVWLISALVKFWLKMRPRESVKNLGHFVTYWYYMFIKP